MGGWVHITFPTLKQRNLSNNYLIHVILLGVDIFKLYGKDRIDSFESRSPLNSLRHYVSLLGSLLKTFRLHLSLLHLIPKSQQYLVVNLFKL